jgi:hypothetical protein
MEERVGELEERALAKAPATPRIFSRIPENLSDVFIREVSCGSVTIADQFAAIAVHIIVITTGLASCLSVQIAIFTTEALATTTPPGAEFHSRDMEVTLRRPGKLDLEDDDKDKNNAYNIL